MPSGPRKPFATAGLRIYQCLRARDGHSFAEDRLYGALWEAGAERPESEETRLVTVGWDRMARLAGMTPRNARENCFRLIEKLSLERVQRHSSEERVGTTYRVYSLDAILARRREAGLEWVVRNRGGVTFVPAPVQDTGPLKGVAWIKGSDPLEDTASPIDVAKARHWDAAGIIQEWLREARAILNRVDAAEADRAWAREILAAHGR